MDTVQIVVLAILQGLTEFLPISSSAHLILFPRLAGWEDQGLAFDVAVHLGTLVAVLGYFRDEILAMTRDWAASLLRRQRVGDSRLAWAVILGTIPVGLAGLLLKGFVEQALRSPLIIAWTTIGFGLLLWVADRHCRTVERPRSEHALTRRDILLIGCAQALALIPGTSRSGVTMTAGLLLGLSRSGAARFSFLLSIPVIVLAGGLSALDLIKEEHVVNWSAMAMGALLSALSAYLCIHLFLKLLDRVGMLPFVIYRLALGAFLLALFWGQ
ncbi:undecaprenyl-diphosphate phosphatase [Thauera sp. WH-1]|uniref:undecaprenyl-diphosphate phosphatase n=1 Tax=Thauera sp. WH-1 TaxID=3398230 RepID=UPI0039FD7220